MLKELWIKRRKLGNQAISRANLPAGHKLLPEDMMFKRAADGFTEFYNSVIADAYHVKKKYTDLVIGCFELKVLVPCQSTKIAVLTEKWRFRRNETHASFDAEHHVLNCNWLPLTSI